MKVIYFFFSILLLVNGCTGFAQAPGTASSSKLVPHPRIHLGMLFGAASEKVRIQGAETQLEGFRLSETNFFQANNGILLGIEIEYRVRSHWGIRTQPAMSLTDATFFLTDPNGTAGRIKVERSSFSVPIHFKYTLEDHDYGFYGCAGMRWLHETGRIFPARPFVLKRGNVTADLGMGYAIDMNRGSLSLEMVWARGLVDQFPASMSFKTGLPDRVNLDRLLIALVLR